MRLGLRLLRPAARSLTSVPAAQLSFGQPLHETHPHLLKAGEGATLPSGSRRVLTV